MFLKAVFMRLRRIIVLVYTHQVISTKSGRKPFKSMIWLQVKSCMKNCMSPIPQCFGVCLSFYWFFWALLHNHCYSFYRTKWRLVTLIWQGPGPVATKMPFFSPKFKSAANFSAPVQERNLFFLSWRLAGKKVYNFPIKSSHLCCTSRHVWLSSSTCDHCCAYQLICISTYTMGARTHFSQCNSLVDLSFLPLHPLYKC